MLKGIPEILSPELIKTLMEMGHGDEIVIADGNFPAANIAKKLIRLDGHPIPKVLSSILKLFPLDQYVEKPAGLMSVVPGDNSQPRIWEDYKKILQEFSNISPEKIESIERFQFYERARKAYAVIATGEKSLYANIILKKGVIN